MDALRTAHPTDVRHQSAHRRAMWLDLITVPIAGIATLCIWLAIQRTPATATTMPYIGVWLHLLLVIYMAGILLLLTGSVRERLRTNGILLWLGLFFFALLALRLKDTPFTVGGINGDARFYTTYVTKMAAYPGYGDMFYKGLPSFYPPLYYFIVGRVADWFAIEPFRVMKAALLTTVIAMPLVTGWLWRRLVDERLAVAVAFCMLVFPDWFKPNEWLALALFVPWWLHWVDNVTDAQPHTRAARWRWWIGGALIGAIIVQLYFFWLFVGGATLLARIGWWLCCQRQEPRVRCQLLLSSGMLVAAALLSAPFWAPYFYSMVTTAGAEPLQNRFFGASKIPLPLYFFDPTWQGVVYMGGLLYLFVAGNVDPIARGLRWLVVGFALWVGVGYIAVLVDMPLLTFRSYPVLAYLLGAGAFLGLFRLWQQSDQWLARWPILPWRTIAATLIGLVLLLFSNGVVNALLSEENVQDAVDGVYPATELAAFDQLTGGDYRERVVFVTDSYRSILFFRPIYSFVAWSAHFSHPAGQFHRRIAFLERLAALHDPQLFAQAVAHNRYDQIDYWLLRDRELFWHFAFVDDNFPERTIDREIYFPKALLPAPYFQAETVAGYTMLKPATIPALPESNVPLTGQPLDAVARSYLLTSDFANDMRIAEPATVRRTSEMLLVNGDLSTLPLTLLLDLKMASTGALSNAVDGALAAALNFPTPITFVDEAGQATVRFLGYQVQPTDAEHVEFTFYWQPINAFDEPYGIWLHAFATGPSGDSAKAVFDHTPPLATTLWSTGHIYADKVTLTLPPGNYRLETGFWQAETDRRLQQPTGEWGITLGPLPLPVP